MVFTARQLQEMHRKTGSVVLPGCARLSPAARDWVRERRLSVVFQDATGNDDAPVVDGIPWLWWCDGACGQAKAGMMSAARDAVVPLSEIGMDSSKLADVIRHLAKELQEKRALGAILLVASGSRAMVFANRCPMLRAVLGTCLDAVDQGIWHVAANVLVIEHPHKTLSEVRTLVGRFVRAPRELSREVAAQLRELASCA